VLRRTSLSITSIANTPGAFGDGFDPRLSKLLGSVKRILLELQV